ncbi:SURF1 family protein [Aliivibrio kagoshimensis]|uniref:SURF1 family protein n=1 Tax=Aliivibrio kagoshimensis TaxID=2910230 RepID=UPI003D0FEE48
MVNRSWLLVAIFTVGLFLLMVKLGFWQLSRASEKASWQQELQFRQQRAALTFEELLATREGDVITGFRSELSIGAVNAELSEQQIILMDNQTFEGTVGYLAYQAVEVAANKPWILVELGFVKAPTRRDELPNVVGLQGEQTLMGRLYQKEVNRLSSELMAEAGWPKRIQNLNMSELSALLKQPLLPMVFQPDSINQQIEGYQNLPHPWKPIPLSAQKHQGYAVQWFSMALVLALIMVAIAIKEWKNKRINS